MDLMQGRPFTGRTLERLKKFLASVGLLYDDGVEMSVCACDDDGEIIGYKFVHLGKMMEMIKNGTDAAEALKKASGQYGRVDDAAKLIDPRCE